MAGQTQPDNKLTKKQIEILEEAIKENATESNRYNKAAIKNTNDSSDKLSSELGYVASFGIGFALFFFEKLSPENSEQKVILIFYFGFLAASILFGVVNKILINHFLAEIIPYSAEFKRIWYKARNSITGDELELVVAFKTANDEDAQNRLTRQGKPDHSPNWPLNTQLFFLAISFILLVIYLIIKIV